LPGSRTAATIGGGTDRERYRPRRREAVGGRMARVTWRLCVLGALLSTWAALSGCSRHGESGGAVDGSQPAAASAVALRILAGSELKELEPDIKQAARASGLSVEISYSGTLDMVDRVNAGERFDALLPPNGAYPVLALNRKPLAREKLFYSR